MILANSGLKISNRTTSLRITSIWQKLQKEHELLFYSIKRDPKNSDFNVINEKIYKSYFSSLLFLLRYFKKTKKPHLIIAESFKAAIIAYFLPFKIPFVWRQYGTVSLGTELVYKKYKLKTILKRLFYSKIIKSKKCLEIIVTLDGCLNKTALEKILKLPKNKIKYIINPMQPLDKKTYIKTENDSFKIIQLGSINKWKKPHVTIRSINYLVKKEKLKYSDIKITIAGKISDNEYYSKLKDYINENELGKIVEFKHNLNKQEVAEIFSSSDISISLTAYSPVIESLTMNTPVIVYNWGEVDDQFDDFDNIEIIGREIRKESFLTQAEESQIVEELAEKIMEAYKKRHIKRNWEQDNKLLEARFPTLEESIEIGYQYYKEVIDKISGSESR